MANRPATIKQAELTRYFKAWRAAGWPAPKTEIKPDGTVVIIPADDKSDNDTLNGWG
jgi:hypothetical protein